LAFLRFSRDKRGYEHFYLIEAPQQRGRTGPARILYWFRTPPNVKVGREPFDAEVRRALEAQNPGASFDWQKFVSTPIPPVEAEHWRERRRAERAAKVAARAASVEEPVETEDAETPEGEPPATADIPSDGPPAASTEIIVKTVETVVVEGASEQPERKQVLPTTNTVTDASSERRRRRRRRRGRRRSMPGISNSQIGGAPGEHAGLSPASPESAETAGTSASGEVLESGEDDEV
jgi:hypothetical protein